MKLKEADIIVGIPSYNEADNISFVVEQASEGLTKYFPNLKSIIVNVDNHSDDDTKHAFLGSNSRVPLKYISTPKGVIGKGNNFMNLFKYMLKIKAKAAVVVDADLKSITPEWVKKLGDPILKGYDYVVPFYSRHKYDGTITNNICYPLIYGLLGKDIRQPIAGDFAFSNRLCKYYLSRKWSNTTHHYGIDIFMTLKAIFGGFKIIQTHLGCKVHKPSAPKLGLMFTQVIYSLFNTIIENKNKWVDIKHTEKAHFTYEHFKQHGKFRIDDILIKRRSLVEYHQHYKKINHFLSPEVFAEVEKSFSKKSIDISSELWAKIVYDLIYKFSLKNNKLDVIKALKSLYFGRVYSFIQESKAWGDFRVEKEFRRQAELFKKLKPYLISKFKK